MITNFAANMMSLVAIAMVCCVVLTPCVNGFVTYEERLAIIERAKVKALRNQMERQRSPYVNLNKTISENHRNPSNEARLRTNARLLLEDLVAIAERDYIELRNGKVSEHEAMSPVDYKRRPGKMFNTEEFRQLYDASGCSSMLSRSSSHCTNRLGVYTYRTIDGTCNNIQHADYGAATTELRQTFRSTYENGISTPAGFSQTVCNSPKDSALIDEDRGGAYCYGDDENCLEEDYLYDDFLVESPATKDPCHNIPRPIDPPMPSPHYITARLVLHKKPFTLPYSDLLLLWGKFVMNDVVNVPDISVDLAPACEECDFSDVCYSVRVSGNDRNISDCLPMRRSVIGCYHDDDASVYLPRRQLNDVTVFLDASVIYGSHKERSKLLRSFDKGQLKFVRSEGLHKLPIADSNDIHCVNTMKDGESVYMCGDYCCVDSDPLTYLHTLFLRFHNNIAERLNELNPHWTDEMVYQESRKIVGAVMQKITYQDYLPKIFTGDYFDAFVKQYRKYNDTLHPQVDTTFSDIIYAGIYFPNYYYRSVVKQKDVMSLIIQRGREHGLPSYTTIRKYIEEKLPLLSQPILKDVSKLEKMYGSMDNVDLVVGALGEQQLMTLFNSSAMVGNTFAVLFGEAFQNIRNADRFFYERRGMFTAEQFEQIDSLTLSSIICQHDDQQVETISSDAFFKNYDKTNCKSVSTLDLTPWKDDTCYVKLSSQTKLSAGQVISVSHNVGTPFLKVYANTQQVPSCLPIKCPTKESPVRLYSLLNIRDHANCSVSSLHSNSQFVEDGQFLNATVEYSMVDDQMMHRTLISCDGASQSFVKWKCLENVDFLLEDANNPDSMLTLPLGLNFPEL